MDPITASIISSIATSYFVNFTYPKVEAFFKKSFEIDPSIESKVKSASTSQDFESVFNEAVGVIDAAADSGTIDVDGTLLAAIRGARFDHQNGFVTIQNSRIEAPKIITGGTGSGKTEIKENTTLKSQGTEIRIGKGCGIKMTGNSQIKQG